MLPLISSSRAALYARLVLGGTWDRIGTVLDFRAEASSPRILHNDISSEFPYEATPGPWMGSAQAQAVVLAPGQAATDRLAALLPDPTSILDYVRHILSAEGVDLLLVDRLSGDPLITLHSATVVHQEISVSVGKLVMRGVRFQLIQPF